MIFLLLSILSSTIITIVFKIQDKYNIKLFPVIVINYIIATALGFIINKTPIHFGQIISSSWFMGALGIGTLLILGFYLIGYSTKKIGISITTVSNKMSVVLPIIFSIFAFSEGINTLKIIGIFIALLSVFFTVYRKKTKEFDNKFIFIPILLFFTIGIIDSLVKFSQSEMTESQIPIFTAISFGLSGITGIILSFFNSTKFFDYFSIKTLTTGIIIGAANFGSMFFVIHALNKSGLDSSIVFGINNVGIISLSVLVAFVFFKEKLRPINWLGIGLSLLAVILLTIN
ncbi:MAG: DMT family transporter [Bacteroidota bacterium]|nr:DMT family transporter [Bacteroidota bacterium]